MAGRIASAYLQEYKKAADDEMSFKANGAALNMLALTWMRLQSRYRMAGFMRESLAPDKK